ncbi:putative inactive receptor kinase [Dissostichus eleginoides]|uniref:Inactive receptor kinase n=1 Tax=Dissostichus eleginoides TaxID=100907 RepID=A0AAD9CBH2_DISEL|nr:putative inactive receptor kinase [Dissostichus eleginoides]
MNWTDTTHHCHITAGLTGSQDGHDRQGQQTNGGNAEVCHVRPASIINKWEMIRADLMLGQTEGEPGGRLNGMDRFWIVK